LWTWISKRKVGVKGVAYNHFFEWVPLITAP
jgi:hypothetical protein